MSRIPIFTLAALGLSSLLGAQRTWIVDAANGAGTDFTNLPPAVAAASDGDSIIMRAGSYTSANLNKTLTVLGQGAVTVSSLTINGLTAGKAVAMAGLDTPAIDLRSNGGRIHIERCRVTQIVSGSTSIQDCRLVTANACAFRVASVLRSKVLLTDCTILPSTTGNPVAWTGTDVDAILIDCSVRGADAVCTFSMTPPSRAMSVNGGTLVLSGDACVIAAGADSASCFSHPPVPAVACGSSAMISRDPGVSVTGTNGGAPFTGSFTLVNESLPAVTAAGAPPGGMLNSDVYAPPGTVSLLLISVATLDAPTPFGTLWLSLPNFSIDAGVIGGSGHRLHSLAVGAGWMRGLSVTLQAVTLPASGPIALSQPVCVLLD